LFDLIALLEASLDFPDEGYHFVDREAAAQELDAVLGQIDALLKDEERGRLIREGLHVAIVGRPNTGKSSLFNHLAGTGRAIVTDVPGTTRDLLTEVVDIHGVPVTLVDTAGVRRHPSDAIEAEGIARASGAREIAALVLLVLDGSMALTDDDRVLLAQTVQARRLVIVNKIDLPQAWNPGDVGGALCVSAVTGDGIDLLRQAMLQAVHTSPLERDVPAITNTRHVELLRRAAAHLVRAAQATRDGVAEEFVLADLHDARAVLEEITGRRAPDAVLQTVFERFCIGK
jgi:tRNA modification GTPase